MKKIAMEAVERQANEHGSLSERKKRIAELKTQVDTLQRQAFALGDTIALPPEVILGVQVVRREPARRVSAA